MGKFRWSVSRLLTYLGCPQAYDFEYVKCLEVPEPWYLVFGAAVHRAIEICHRGNPHQRFTPTAERPLFFRSAEKFGAFWIGHWQRIVADVEPKQGITWAYPKQREDLAGLGYVILAGTKDGQHRGYYDCILHPPFPIEILAVEQTVTADLWGYPFRGRLDQIWRTRRNDKPAIAVVDLTTGRANEVKFLQTTAYDLCFRQWRERDPQLRQRFQPEEIVHFVWSLREEKLIPTRPQPAETLRESLASAVDGIERGNFHQTQQDLTCRSCRFRGACGKTVGEPIPLATTEPNGQLDIAFPERPSAPPVRQLHFQKGADGGWIRGSQVRGED